MEYEAEKKKDDVLSCPEVTVSAIITTKAGENPEAEGRN